MLGSITTGGGFFIKKASAKLLAHYDISNPACYPGSGTALYDLSGNGHNGAFVNGVSYNSVNYGSLVFDGTAGQHVSLPYKILQGGMDFTIECWLKWNTAGTNTVNITVFCNYPAGNLQTLYSSRFPAALWMNNQSCYPSQTEYVAGIVHVAWVKKAGHLVAYINGKKVKFGQSLDTIGNTTNFRLGCNTSNAEVFTGNIYMLKVYNRPLYEREIKAHYLKQLYKYS